MEKSFEIRIKGVMRLGRKIQGVMRLGSQKEARVLELWHLQNESLIKKRVCEQIGHLDA